MNTQETKRKAISVIKIALRMVPWVSALASLIILLISLFVIAFEGKIILFEPNPVIYSAEIGMVGLTIICHFKQGYKLLFSLIHVQESAEGQ